MAEKDSTSGEPPYRQEGTSLPKGSATELATMSEVADQQGGPLEQGGGVAPTPEPQDQEPVEPETPPEVGPQGGAELPTPEVPPESADLGSDEEQFLYSQTNRPAEPLTARPSYIGDDPQQQMLTTVQAAAMEPSSPPEMRILADKIARGV